jgi:hypothetical protein
MAMIEFEDRDRRPPDPRKERLLGVLLAIACLIQLYSMCGSWIVRLAGL